VGFNHALRAEQSYVIDHPTAKKLLTDSMKDDIESIVSEAQVEINQAIMNQLDTHAEEDLDKAMDQILEGVVGHLSDFSEEKIKDYAWVLRKSVDLIANKGARRAYLQNIFQKTYHELSIQKTNYPSKLDEVITARVDAILTAQAT
jgi:hypothetical protein